MPFEKRAPVDDLTEKINGCAFRVHNQIGCGFLEKIYENALRIELTSAGLEVLQQVPCRILYERTVVGEYVADLVVENSVIVEIKACEGIAPAHKAQAINYLAASGLNVALLLNFGRPRLEIRRLVRKSQLAAPAAAA
jgi:GxxExxY protein